MKRILYKKDGALSVIIPSDDAINMLGLEEVAIKDVPFSVPFLIVEASEIPEDRTFREAWDADFTEPHGFGLGAQRWFIQKANEHLKCLDLLEPPAEPVLAVAEDDASPDEKLEVDMLNAIAQENYAAELDSFLKYKNAETARALELIAVMKAEILEIEGVLL